MTDMDTYYLDTNSDKGEIKSLKRQITDHLTELARVYTERDEYRAANKHLSAVDHRAIGDVMVENGEYRRENKRLKGNLDSKAIHFWMDKAGEYRKQLNTAIEVLKEASDFFGDGYLYPSQRGQALDARLIEVLELLGEKS